MPGIKRRHPSQIAADLHEELVIAIDEFISFESVSHTSTVELTKDRLRIKITVEDSNITESTNENK
jgi:hypothetical protein